MSVYWKNVPKGKQERFYKALVTKNYAEAASEIGMAKHYAESNLRSVGYQLYGFIKPEELGISEDIQKMVREAIDNRKISNKPVKEDTSNLDFTPAELIDPKDNKQVVISGRNKAAMLLHKKMDRISKSPKLLDGLSLTQLATTFAIMFDKSQIVTGQATENISVMAKIDSNMSTEETLDAILKMREAEVISKTEK